MARAPIMKWMWKARDARSMARRERSSWLQAPIMTAPRRGEMRSCAKRMKYAREEVAHVLGGLEVGEGPEEFGGESGVGSIRLGAGVTETESSGGMRNAGCAVAAGWGVVGTARQNCGLSLGSAAGFEV